MSPGAKAWHLAVIVFAVFVGAAWFLYAEHGIAGQWGFSLDDSWIYATFARNLATGQGYAFNPGEHVAGATGPLYVFILGFLYILFHDVVWPAKILGVVCLAASSVLMYFAARRMDPSSSIKPLMAGLLVALSPSLLWGALGGMEVPVYLLLACLGAYFYIGEQWTLATLSWALGVWLRPDGMFLLLLGLIARPGITFKSVLGPGLVATLVVGAYVAFNFATGGGPLPASVGVKAHLGANILASGWSMARQWLDLWGLALRVGHIGVHCIILLPALVMGAITTIRRWPALTLYVFAFPLVFAIFGASGGQFGRYIIYVVPIGFLLAVHGLESGARRLAGHRHTAILVALGLICLGWQGFIAKRMGISHGWNIQNINGMHRFVAEATQRATSPGDTVAVNDVGAMGYFSQCYVVDLVGLVSPKRLFPDNLRIFKPKYMAIFPDWYQTYATIDPGTNQVVFFSGDSTYKYSPFLGVRLRRNTISSRNTMYIYERMGRDEVGTSRVQLVVH